MKKLIILSVILPAAFSLYGNINRIPADYPTIQKGIDAAKNGDTVLVSPGTYVENIGFNGKNITVASLFLTTRDTSYISRTVIDGNKAGSVVTFSSETRVAALLSGFTITNGGGYYGGGIYCWNSAAALESLVISGNSASQGGGLYLEWSSSPTLENVTISNNAASWNGGGIYCTSDSKPVFSSIRRCNIYLNSASEGNDLYSVSYINVIVDTFTVLKPQAYHAFPLSSFTFDILHGKLVQAEGDVYVSPDGDNGNSGFTPDDPLKNLRLAYNILVAGSLHPGTIHLLAGKYSPSTTNEKFPIILPKYISFAGASESNVIVDAEGTGSVFQFNDNTTSHISGLTITGGSAGNGGGIFCQNSSPTLRNLIISGNSVHPVGGWGWYGGSGGGIYCDNSSPTIENVFITNNSAQTAVENIPGLGGGMYCTNNSKPTLENVTIANNTASSQGGGIYCIGDCNPVFDSINRCNIYLNSATQGNDLYSNSPFNIIKVIVDTFTVLKPQAYHAFPLSGFTFDILHGKIVQAEGDVYVSPDGDNGNSGHTPDDPLKTLRQAYSILAADSLDPCTIRLLAGKYSPSTTNEKFPVILPDYVSLAGINKKKVIVDAEGTGKVFLFDGNSTSNLSGITITGGNSDSGGGIYCGNSSPTLEDLIISGNSVHPVSSWGWWYGGSGGGIYCDNSSPTIENVVITDNSAQAGVENAPGYGGGMYCTNNSKPTLQNVTISNNMASSVGGGMYFYESLPVFDSINRCNIYLNSADQGNDLFSSSPIKVILDTFTVLKPQAYHAFPHASFTFDILHGKLVQAEGDVYVSPDGDNGNSGVTPDDPLKTFRQAYSILAADSLNTCTIRLLEGKYSPSTTNEKFPVILPDHVNLAGINKKKVIVDAEGTGRVFNFDGNFTSQLSGVTITGGKSDLGGGIYCGNSSPTIENLIISGNSAVSGGGMYTTNSGPIMRNVTVTGNTAYNVGGGICFGEGSNFAFDSTDRCNIYFNNALRGRDLYTDLPVHVVLDTFSVLNPTAYYAQPIPNFSFDILHSKLTQAYADIYVSPSGDNSNSGLADSVPLKTMNYALSVLVADSLNPRTINLMNGTFGPSFSGETLPVTVPDYVNLKGTGRSNVSLMADGAANVFRLENNSTSKISGFTVSGAAVAGIYLINSNAILEDINVSNNSGAGIRFENNDGSALHDVFLTDNAGGGAISSSSHPRLEDVTISGNSVSGFSCNDSQTILEKVTITQNSGTGFTCSGNNTGALLRDVVISKNSGKYGGGMNLAGISPEFRNVVVSENFAMFGGGACTSTSLSDVHFSYNTAMYGGGLCILSDTYPRPLMVNLVVDHNVAQFGGGFYASQEISKPRPYLKNVTCTDNLANLGGGIFSGNGGGSVLYNTILWNNYPEQVFLDNGYFSTHSSNVQGGEPGIERNNGSTVRWNEGSMNEDPLFSGRGDHPYMLIGNSPCIDAGTTRTGMALPALDILGNNRFWDGNGDGLATVDMGAYEFFSSVSGLTDLSIQNPEIQVKIYPNPFSYITTIEYELGECGEVVLTVFNNIGQPVTAPVNEFQSPGRYQVEWSGEGLPAGIYYIQLRTSRQVVKRKILKL